MTTTEYQALNASVHEKFLTLNLVEQARTVLMYYSINREVETISIIKELLQQGKKVALPVCTVDLNLEACMIGSLEELVPRKFGIMEPKDGVLLSNTAVLDLVVVPGLALDQRGYRIGHGAGYYDRFLAKVNRTFKLGLAYDFQVLEEIPADPYDIPMDGLLTPEKFLNCVVNRGGL